MEQRTIIQKEEPEYTLISKKEVYTGGLDVIGSLTETFDSIDCAKIFSAISSTYQDEHAEAIERGVLFRVIMEETPSNILPKKFEIGQSLIQIRYVNPNPKMGIGICDKK